jgi:hypothetical protein
MTIPNHLRFTYLVRLVILIALTAHQSLLLALRDLLLGTGIAWATVSRHRRIQALHLLHRLVLKKTATCLEVDSILHGITKLEVVDTRQEVLLYQPWFVGQRVHIQEATGISVDVRQLLVRQSQLRWAKTMERGRTGRSVYHPRGRRKRCRKGTVLLGPRVDTRTPMGTPRVDLLGLVARTVLVLLIDLLPPVQQPLDLLLVLLTRITMRVLRMP